MSAFILIDFESVQPDDISSLDLNAFKIVVFVGANQHRISFDFASTMQPFGQSARYIKISGNGKNALDFHIAYYIGELSASDPGAEFYIISRDNGFNPLINHLSERGITVMRCETLLELPVCQANVGKS